MSIQLSHLSMIASIKEGTPVIRLSFPTCITSKFCLSDIDFKTDKLSMLGTMGLPSHSSDAEGTFCLTSDFHALVLEVLGLKQAKGFNSKTPELFLENIKQNLCKFIQ